MTAAIFVTSGNAQGLALAQALEREASRRRIELQTYLHAGSASVIEVPRRALENRIQGRYWSMELLDRTGIASAICLISGPEDPLYGLVVAMARQMSWPVVWVVSVPGTEQERNFSEIARRILMDVATGAVCFVTESEQSAAATAAAILDFAGTRAGAWIRVQDGPNG